MATITVRFRGVCCFIDPPNGEKFKKRVVLPNGKSHHDMEQHLSVIEFFADDLKSAPDDLPRFEYTRPGDGGQYQCIPLDEPVLIELLNTSEQGKITQGLNLDDSVIHLDILVDEEIKLKQTLLGPAESVDSKLVSAVVDLPKGVLMAGPPEPMLTKFPGSPKFRARRAARWLEHITQIADGKSFGLRLTPLGKPRSQAREIWFEDSTSLITIANEPLRFIVGHFAASPPKPLGKTKSDTMEMATSGGVRKTTGHFDMYWDLIADPRSRPVPEPFQGIGPGCVPANKP